MDAGDLLALLFIVSALLSSLAGGKKKQQRTRPRVPQTRPPPQRRPQPVPSPGPRGAPPDRKWPDPDSPDRMPTQMEEILRQLGLDVGTTTVEPDTDEFEVREEVERELPRVVSLEGPSLEETTIDPVARHARFHEDYIRPSPKPYALPVRKRGKLRLRPENLREAIVMHEILGPPKGIW